MNQLQVNQLGTESNHLPSFEPSIGELDPADQEQLDKLIEKLKATTPRPKIRVYIDIDDTLIYLKLSTVLNQIVFNRYVIKQLLRLKELGNVEFFFLTARPKEELTFDWFLSSTKIMDELKKRGIGIDVPEENRIFTGVYQQGVVSHPLDQDGNIIPKIMFLLKKELELSEKVLKLKLAELIRSNDDNNHKINFDEKDYSYSDVVKIYLDNSSSEVDDAKATARLSSQSNLHVIKIIDEYDINKENHLAPMPSPPPPPEKKPMNTSRFDLGKVNKTLSPSTSCSQGGGWPTAGLFPPKKRKTLKRKSNPLTSNIDNTSTEVASNNSGKQNNAKIPRHA